MVEGAAHIGVHREDRTGMSSTDKIRVFLAYDQELVRRGIALILGTAHDMEVVGEAHDGLKAVDEVAHLRPNVVLMDPELPGISGIDATRQILDATPGVSVLMCTIFERDDLLSRSFEAGARGFLPKAANVDDLLSAIRTVHLGGVIIHPSMATKLLHDYVARLKGRQDGDPYEKLSAREREVLPMIADGRSPSEIGEALHISPYTVQTYRQRIMRKLGVHSATELLKYALRRGVVHLDPHFTDQPSGGVEIR